MAFFEEVILSFITIFVIMDPFASIPAFISLSKEYNATERNKAVNEAIIVAGALILVFLLLSHSIFDFFGISLSSFKIAGGIVLAILGLELALGISLTSSVSTSKHSIAVLIGTPLLTGPGVISSVILLVSQYGVFPVAVASALSLAVSYLLLRNAHLIHDAVGKEAIEVVSRVMGLLLIAIGVELIRTALTAK